MNAHKCILIHAYDIHSRHIKTSWELLLISYYSVWLPSPLQYSHFSFVISYTAFHSARYDENLLRANQEMEVFIYTGSKKLFISFPWETIDVLNILETPDCSICAVQVQNMVGDEICTLSYVSWKMQFSLNF